MKIVDINPYFFPVYGGIEHRMHLIAKGLAERGHEVTIVTSQIPGMEAEERSPDGYDIVRLPSKFINIYNPPYVSSKGLLRKLNEIDADVVNFNYRWAPSYSRDMKKYRGKKVFTYHNMWGEGIGWQHYLSDINDRMFKSTLKTFDHILTVSDFVRDDLIRRGFPADGITVATPFFEELPEVPETDDGYILSLGRLVRTKGLDYLIEAMRHVDAKLVLCGKGPDDKRLKREAERFGVSDKIEFRGWISEEEKDDVIRGCRLFVIPSLYESYGLAASEVMAFGKPIVSTNVNGLPSTVKDGGILVPPKDPKALADAINGLLNNEEERKRLGHNARKVTENMTASVVLDIIEDVYDRVVKE